MKEPESICWNCKKACGKRQKECPWAWEFNPVEGWEAQVGNEFHFCQEHDFLNHDTPGYIVKKCPLYERNHHWFTAKECVTEIAKYYKVRIGSVYRSAFKYFRNYERDTKIEIPLWIYEEIKDSNDKLILELKGTPYEYKKAGRPKKNKELPVT